MNLAPRRDTRLEKELDVSYAGHLAGTGVTWPNLDRGNFGHRLHFLTASQVYAIPHNPGEREGSGMTRTLTQCEERRGSKV